MEYPRHFSCFPLVEAQRRPVKSGVANNQGVCLDHDQGAAAPIGWLPAGVLAETDVRGWNHSQISEVLQALRHKTGVDFSRYRRATVLRRIRNRMVSAGIDSLSDYLGLLCQRPGEAGRLLERLTIKVSRFYRNVRSFDLLRDEVLPLLARARGKQPLRLWSAGCGRGEEAWTLAMLLEHAGIAGDVLASDIDRGSLAEAARAVYRPELLADLPANLAAAYLEPVAGGSSYRLREGLRSRVRFVRHDLLHGEPPARQPFDLVCCRNVLIYLEPQAQSLVFRALCSTLAPGGYLCLGEAEWPSAEVLARLRCVGRNAQVWRQIPEEAAA